MRPTALTIALLMFLCTMPGIVESAGSGNYPPPLSGDWLVANNTTVSDETISLGGNLTVENATLTLDNVTITGNLTDGTIRLAVTGNGAFTTRNCTFSVGTCRYLIFDLSGNAAFSNSSFIRGAGEIRIFSGGNSLVLRDCVMEATVYLQNRAHDISSTVIRNSGRGVVLDDGINISNLTVDNCTTGCFAGENSTVSDCNFNNCTTGVDTGPGARVVGCAFTSCGEGVSSMTPVTVNGCAFSDCITGATVSDGGNITATSFTGSNRSILLQGGSLDIRNSTMSGPENEDVLVSSGLCRLLGTDFASGRVQSKGILEVYWYVSCLVNYRNTTAAAGSVVKFSAWQDQSSILVPVNDYGQTVLLELLEYRKTTNGTVDYTPYWVNASKDNFSRNLSVNINQNQDLTMVLSDSTPPEIYILGPEDTSLLNRSTVPVYGWASDDSGLEMVRVRCDGGNWETANGTSEWLRTFTLPDGNHVIEAEALDSEQNSDMETVRIRVDTREPFLAIDSPPPGALVNTSKLTVNGRTENGSLLIVDESVVPLVNGAFEATVLLHEGKNTIRIESRDAAGNANTTSLSVTRDTIFPSISVSTPQDGEKVGSSTVVVGGTVESGALVTVNGITADISGSFFCATVTLNDGFNSIMVVATDGAGNRYTIVVHVSGDFQPPSLLLDVVDGYSQYCSTCRLTGHTDPGAGVMVNGMPVQVDAGGYFTVTVTLLPGPNLFTIQAIDPAGNTVALNRTIYRTEPPAPKIPPVQPGVTGVSVTLLGAVAGLVLAVSIAVISGFLMQRPAARKRDAPRQIERSAPPGNRERR